MLTQRFSSRGSDPLWALDSLRSSGRPRRWAWAMAWLTLAAISGCDDNDGLVKVIVKGKVSYAGQPIANGDIKFYPANSTPGPVSGAAIKDGHYIVKNKNGVPVGQHMVQIRAFRVEGGGSSADDDLISVGRAEGEQRTVRADRGQYIPPKYNRESELLVEVSKDNKELDFDLEK